MGERSGTRPEGLGSESTGIEAHSETVGAASLAQARVPVEEHAFRDFRELFGLRPTCG